MKAQKCPVCEGARKVPEELYTGKPTIPDPKLVKCKNCKGEGYLLVPSEEVVTIPFVFERPEPGDPKRPPYKITRSPYEYNGWGDPNPYWEMLPKTYC